MNNHQVFEIIDKIAPLSTQAAWDNSGVQLGFGPRNVKKILVAMEITNEVIDEAIKNNVQLIVTHHPLIFEAMKTIHACDPRGLYVQRLIKAEIMVYSCHTPFDICKGGNTDYLMKLMGCTGIKVVPETDNFLKIGNLKKVYTLGDFAYELSQKLGLDGLKFVGEADKKIKTVACCTGAGDDYWYESRKIADVLVTGDVRHHNAQFARDCGLAVIDAGHWGTEQTFVQNMGAMLKKAVGENVEIILSQVNQNPFHFML